MSLSNEELWHLIENQDNDALNKLMGVQGIARMLDTDLKKGINSTTIQSRISKFGSNQLPDRPIRSFWSMLNEALKDGTVRILIVCSILSLVLEFMFAPEEEKSTAWIDGAAIFAAVVIVTVVQATQNLKQEQQFAAVNRIKSIYDVAVIRDGEIHQIQNHQLVVGDIVEIQQGDCIPADGLVITSENLKIDQSTANGESEAIVKSEKDPFLISNTHVVEGCGTFLVICVGLNSHHGRIFALINSEIEETPLQVKLEALAEKIGLVGIIVASLTFIALLIQWIISQVKFGFEWAHCREPLTYFVISITIVACAVPEGLPLAVTISLAYSMNQMMADNNFVRRLSACETMGSVTVICSDKTGTLTENKMNVERIAIGPIFLNVPDLDSSNIDEELLLLIRKSISINTQAVLTDQGSIGSQTECALLRFVSRIHGNYQQLRIAFPPVIRFLFDRDRKRMSTVIPWNGMYRTFVKGAPDEIIKLCTNFVLPGGKLITSPVSDDFKQQFMIAVNSEGEKTYRTLSLAYKDTHDLPQTWEDAEKDLTLLCTVSIRDSIRPTTISSIDQCKKAGIKVIMITGDHSTTAEAVAKECGILVPGTRVILGSEVRKMAKSDLIAALPTISVVARSSPMDKHLIVSALKAAGESVAVTGDGTNDVPAMMAADVGLSMGKCGTELAKEASDIVVLDDDFRSIVKAVVWGRCVYNNIRRFLQFQLTANVVTLFVSFLSAAILNETPFKAVQLLWVNLIMDSLGALALATGRPDESLLRQKPEKKDAPLIDSFMLKNIIGQSVLQILLIGYVLLFPYQAEQYSMKHYTFLFNVFVLCQDFNLVNARVSSKKMKVTDGIQDNYLFFIIQIGIMIVQILLIQIAGVYIYCAPMTMIEWIYSTFLAALTLPMGAFLRAVHFENYIDKITSRRGANRNFEQL
ncbi:calcium-translocating P-type ATPase, PMCA-type family protein [Trichomonas vaginalis G3]|uniref:Calcium-transporting ATPase n=1 Tax=Trichomonas vaginalis (strain ATCC PRA-98 / G3) TaxID=412133 RepID=A2DSU9_TRIV3|nr:calcium-transporting ATPase protein [Trichomonas vaginalis G3]EAY16498.1 calcium-translocating P-type ATPase, PMCA-type family protein [Trichomonas vaginalis G3]KAI5488023.1 calcium-transporting ATPase protein [Trichomonas vaginalis G3]|eukprot:XP_001328721.1 calcium-translocating P-type ATPase, PMCA-type family protein [Trichomonas vaginalis G3]